MKLVSWNVNSLKARLPRVLELLDEHHPDVLCLQETKCEPAAFAGSTHVTPAERQRLDRIGSCGFDRGFRKGPKPSDHAPLLLCLCDT